LLFLSSCVTDQVIIDNKSLQSYRPVRYSLIFIIHGDGSYRYHDSDGNAYNADEDVLQQTLEVAGNCAQCEVFIFHQKKKRRVLGFIPLKDGEFYYFRNGVLLDRKVYSRRIDDGVFKGEIELVKSRSDRSYGRERELATFFLYFGHQIPEWTQSGYHSSYPQIGFTIQNFAAGIEGFRNIYSPRADKFDLIVLSTCYSGTPGVISTLLPHSHYIIASPDNLHLSHINVGIFKQLDGSKDIYHFAKTAVQRAFDKLRENTKTMITIALYDTMEVAPYLKGVAEEYKATLDSVVTLGDRALIEFYDCLDNPDLDMGLSDKGIDMFYQAPRFGRQKNKTEHSGWECVRLKQTE
jgi:hypothetical protein